MVIFSQLLPLPPAEGALRAEGDGSFVSRIELSQQLRKFQESLYQANRRQRNYGHI